MPRMLGDAFVTISPDTSDFRAKADAQIKRALAGLKYTVPIGLDTEGTLNAIRTLQARIRQMGLADFLDVNIPVGKLIAQIQVIRRLLNQAGVADILEVDLDKASLARALATIGKLSSTIPVSFDLGALPVVGPLQALAEKVPVTFDMSQWPVDLEAAQQLADRMKIEVPVSFDISGLPHISAAGATEKIGIDVTGIASASAALASLAAAEKLVADRESGLAAATVDLSGGLMAAGTAAKATALAAGDEVPLLNRNITALGGLAGWFGQNAVRAQLFGGVLTKLGVPAILATATATHIAADALIEFAAVIIPAGVAFGAFGALAVPTAQHIYVQLTNIWTAANALNTSIYPLSTSMRNLDAAIRPEVYTLFGEALVVVTKNTGVLTTIASQAGQALTQLGARAAVALTSGGFATFLKEGPADLAKIGDIIGNIFGTIGNLLRTLPGYAQILLSALDAVTKGIESITGSKLGQWAAEAFLYFHGFILLAGLAVTAAIGLGNALLALGAKFGIVDSGMKVFNAEQFAGGLKLVLGSVINLGVALVTMAGAEDVAAAATGVLAGTWAAITAIDPVVWIAAAAVGLGILIDKLVTARSAAQDYADSVQKAEGTQPVTQLGLSLVTQQAIAVTSLASAQKNLRSQNAAISAEWAGTTTTLANLDQRLAEVQQKTGGLTQTVADQQALLPVLAQDMKNYSAVLTAAGGSTQVLSDAGITSNQILGATGEQLKQLEVLAAATADQERTFATNTGRAGAVMNALNYTGDTTNNMLGSMDVDMQKVVTGMDQMTSVILGGEQAFLSFQDSVTGASATLSTPPGLANAAKVAGASIGGLNAQSQALANNFYNYAIPSFQKLIDATSLQLISTQDLTKVVATGAAQMIPYIGNNEEARSVLIAMINDALGPNTVSLQTLNKWVGQNSTSLQGFNAIIAKSTIQAATLANVLQSDLNAQFAQSLLKTSGATAAMDAFTNAITHGGTQTDAYRAARQRLISDLEATGLTATQAKNYVNNLQRQIDALTGKTVGVGVTLSGSGTITINAAGTGAVGLADVIAHVSLGHAAGGKITQGTGPTADDVLARVSKGETVVSAADSKVLAPFFAAMGVPGYQGGGLVGVPPVIASWSASDVGKDANAIISTDVSAILAAYRKQASAGSAAGVGTGQGAGYTAFAAAAGQAMRDTGVPASWLPDLSLIALYESGYNPYAVNRSDINWQEGHPCVPLDSLILTRHGWLRHDEVRPGDETIGYNPQAGRSEWTLITAVHEYPQAEVWRIGNRTWNVRCTPNHRWWSDTLTRVQPAFTICPDCDWVPHGTKAPARGVQVHRNKIHGISPASGPRNTLRGEFVRTQDLRSGHRVRVAAPADTEGIPGLSTENAAIIGWIMGDGHVQKAYRQPALTACPECGWLPGHRKPSRGPLRPEHMQNSIAVHRATSHGIAGGGNDPSRETEDAGWDVSIYQSKPGQVIRLRALLAHVPHAESVRDRGQLPAHQFKLRRAYATDLLKLARYGEVSPEDFVLALSPDQRAAWLAAMIDAEGHTEDGFTRIAQNDGPVADAIRLAVYLEGYRPTFSRFRRRSTRHKPGGTIGMCARPHLAPSMFAPAQDLGREAVWCVTTELGTWTMQQDGQVMLTGNSVGLMQVIAGTYAAYGARQFGYPAPVAYGVSEDSVANIGAAINYIKARYGSVFNVPGVISVNSGGGYVGYDNGGWLPPGMSMAWNGTGTPEAVIPGGTMGGASPGGPVTIQLEITGSTGSGTFDSFLTTWLKNNVRIKGGGNVQRAWGRTH